MSRRFVPIMVWLFTLPLASGAAQFGDFTYASDGIHITITDYTGTGGAIAIPDTIEGLPVTAIGDSAFSSRSSLTSVIIPESVATIGSSAFWSCSGLTNVKIPSSVTSIGNSAFSSCPGLTSVLIPDSVSSIGYAAFGQCTSLTDIAVDAWNAQYCSLDGVLFDKSQTSLLQYPAGKVGSYAIPDHVTTIGAFAFYGCRHLTGATIPDHVTTIGGGAFASCHALTSIVIPDGVTALGGTFDNCSSLTHVTLGEGVTSIGDFTFSFCTSLTQVTFGPRITSIGDHAFSDCDSLTTMTIPDGVTTLGYAAFASCDALTSVTIPRSVTTIGERAFAICPALRSVYFTGDYISPGESMFEPSYEATVYYLPSTLGWTASYADRPARLWNPLLTNLAPATGTPGMAFTVTGTPEIPIAVEVTSDLLAGPWTRLSTTVIPASGTIDFTDPDAADQPVRFYRVSGP